MDFDTRLQEWLEANQKLLNDYYKDIPTLNVPQLSLMRGKRYVRVVRTDPGSRSVHVFVDITNGDILKPASWKAPAKHARGNIFDKFKGMKWMSAYGAAYLR
jgi:hypothetical protein